MAQNRKSGSGVPAWPIIATLVLLGLAGWLFYLVWEREAALALAHEKYLEETATLEMRKNTLANVLRLAPCEARDALLKLDSPTGGN